MKSLIWSIGALLSPLALAAQTYHYDTVGRVSAVAYADNTGITYTYDAAGNRLTQTAASAPKITTDLQAQLAYVGDNATLSVSVTGTDLSYQWFKNGTAITGATSATLTLSGVQKSDGGNYSVVVSNFLNTVSSATAVLSVGTTRLVNISCRAAGGTGNNVAIGGFVISGSASKKLLLRAVGPTLTTQGIGQSEVMLDPTIELHDALNNNAVIATNDNWGDNTNPADITATAAQLGATALASGDTKSSAVILTLPPSVYSFIARGKDNTSGVVLVEVYDADPMSANATLVNISARAYCTTGNGVSIGGYVVNGHQPKRVLLRAVGPTLTTQGIGTAEVLQDPTIEVHDALNGNAVIATNDNWGDNTNPADITTVGARLGATPLAASDTQSSALILMLKPGVYSFIAHGKNNSSGIVLVEVYDAD